MYKYAGQVIINCLGLCAAGGISITVLIFISASLVTLFTDAVPVSLALTLPTLSERSIPSLNDFTLFDVSIIFRHDLLVGETGTPVGAQRIWSLSK